MNIRIELVGMFIRIKVGDYSPTAHGNTDIVKNLTLDIVLLKWYNYV